MCCFQKLYWHLSFSLVSFLSCLEAEGTYMLQKPFELPIRPGVRNKLNSVVTYQVAIHWSWQRDLHAYDDITMYP